MYEIRRLHSADANDFRAIRLAGLRHFPEAFGSSFSEESAKDINFFADRLEQNAMFGGYSDTNLLGVVGFYSLQPEKLKHVGKLWGMYVLERHRGSGLAWALVDTLLDHARKEVELVQLGVGSTNLRAHHFYKKYGFIKYGVEPHAIKVDGTYIDEILMYKFLN